MSSVDVALVDNDIPFRARLITGDEVTIQRVETRLRMFLGEALLDASLGLPYLEITSTKSVSRPLFATQIEVLIINTPGVSSVTDLNMTMQNREMRVTANVVLESSEVFEFTLAPLNQRGIYNHPYVQFRRLNSP